MRAFLAIFIISGSIYLFSLPVYAQVIINEISPASDPEWVELYNNSTQDIDLEGWEVTDKQTGQYGFGITITRAIQNSTISGYGYLVVKAPEGKTLLKNDGETVYLYSNQNQDSPQDSVTYEKITDKEKSFSRSPNGSSNWLVTVSSENASNTYTTPTPTQSPTSTPTNTPSATKSITTTQKPTSTSTPSFQKSTTPTTTSFLDSEPSITDTDYPELVLGQSVTPSLTETTIEPEKSTPKTKLLPLILVASGVLILASLAAYIGYNHYYKPKSSKIPSSD